MKIVYINLLDSSGNKLTNVELEKLANLSGIDKNYLFQLSEFNNIEVWIKPDKIFDRIVAYVDEKGFEINVYFIGQVNEKELRSMQPLNDSNAFKRIDTPKKKKSIEELRKKFDLDVVLDKINKFGIWSLEGDEIDFLDSFKDN